MKAWLSLVIVGLLLGSSGGILPVSAADDGWEQVGPGVEYHEFHLEGPIEAFVARMDRSNQSVFLDSALAYDQLTRERETVPAMAERANGAVNFWSDDVGATNRVVVAINGSYIDRLTGLVLSGQVESGWFVKHFDNGGGESGFVWKYDRSAFIGGCVVQQAQRQRVTFPNTGVSMRIAGINEPREEDTLVLYTPQYSTSLRNFPLGVEMVVEVTQPVTVMPAPQAVHGFVREIRDGQDSAPIPFDSVVLSAHGKAREALLANLNIGDQVDISQEITSLDPDCRTPSGLSWSKTYASIGGAFAYLRNGEIYHMDDPGATWKHPRTAIAYNDQYIFFIVVDGRIPEYSIGMTFDELAIFTRDALGATWGMAQDGGGSSTMLVNGVVKNQPVSLCAYNSYLPVISNVSYSPGQNSAYASEVYRCLRPVGNAMMMIVSEPSRFSSAFRPFDIVAARKYADLRLGPGSNYGVLADLNEGQTGIVLHHLGGLDGVYAKGANWWKVSFGGLAGWVKETDLTQVRRPLTNIPIEP